MGFIWFESSSLWGFARLAPRSDESLWKTESTN
jgi:hypothetical protein